MALHRTVPVNSHQYWNHTENLIFVSQLLVSAIKGLDASSIPRFGSFHASERYSIPLKLGTPRCAGPSPSEGADFSHAGLRLLSVQTYLISMHSFLLQITRAGKLSNIPY